MKSAAVFFQRSETAWARDSVVKLITSRRLCSHGSQGCGNLSNGDGLDKIGSSLDTGEKDLLKRREH